MSTAVAYPVTTRTTHGKLMSRLIRAACGMQGHPCPITMIPGNAAPEVQGRSYYHTTPGGKFVRYPNAYGYPTVYHASTLKIVVGLDWVRDAVIAERNGGK